MHPKILFTYEGEIKETKLEDGGRACIIEIDGDSGLTSFVRLQSWDQNEVPEHKELQAVRKATGKVVRITVEQID